MTQLRLILGDQLNLQHSWFASRDDSVIYVMMEVREETDYVLHHAQKVLAIFSAMREFARQLREHGHRVEYIEIDAAHNLQSIPANLDLLIGRYKARSIRYQAPDEWRLDAILSRYAQAAQISVTMVDSEHFYTGRHEARDLFGARRRWLMETFYRHMRVRHAILMGPSGQPEGGTWNYDHDNRQAWRGTPPAPADLRPTHDHRALWASIQAAGVRTFGAAHADRFRWPLHRAEALAQLDHFIDHALPCFGAYQDAMHSGEPYLFHSLLSFALNVKMLNPAEVVDRAVAAWREKRAPLASVEGFVRQILGWREYVRGMYWSQMPDYVEHNALGHTRPLPDWFWTGRTAMRCVAQALGQSLELAYAHHIQRLMVIGNFALLAGLDPREVHRWYLGVYIDAFEWVELPNTLGMSQYADGGKLASKPYVSSAAYIDRMSNHCADCQYDKKVRTGPRACPFNALYWHFFDRHAQRLSANPRLAMVYRQWGKTAPDTQQALLEQAEIHLTKIEQL